MNVNTSGYIHVEFIFYLEIAEDNLQNELGLDDESIDPSNADESECEDSSKDDSLINAEVLRYEEISQPAIFEDFPEFSSNSPILSQHFRCASHTINLMATTDVSKTINASRQLQKQHQKTVARCDEL